MLEGKEVQGKIGNEGEYSVDVTEQGAVVIEVAFAKDIGAAKVMSSNKVEISLFAMLEQVCAKNSITWDDQVLAGLEKMLGIKK